MHEKLDENYERKIRQLAQNRIDTGNFKLFDYRARAVSKITFPEFVEAGKTQDETCLIITNADGETIALTKEFARILFNALKNDS
jgi:hypothetical protein